MLMLLIFLHSMLLEIVHNLSFYDNYCVYLIDLYTTYFVLDIRYFMPIHQQVS